LGLRGLRATTEDDALPTRRKLLAEPHCVLQCIVVVVIFKYEVLVVVILMIIDI